MKKYILIIATLLVFGLSAAIFAYQQTNSATKTAMSCCCKGDSCPMKKKDASGKEISCCDKDDCCGDSCPMKKKGDKPQTVDAGMNAAEKECCCPCCNSEKDAPAA